jgi:hypothetical protein
MQKALLILLTLAIGISNAEARRWHRHHHGSAESLPPQQVIPLQGLEEPFDNNGAMPPARFDGRAEEDVARLLPPEWRLMPEDPNWKGRRYVSPDGAAWVAFYATQVGEQTVAAHMQAVAFVEGEQITFLRGERDWIVVSGLKDDRIFYRKAALACAGRSWQHVAFEYPAEAKRELDRLVMRLSRNFDRSVNAGCEPSLISQ